MKANGGKQAVDILGIIPARWASSRLPGKPLAEIGGRPMIELVCQEASKAVDRVIVATDDERIVAAVEARGIEAVMTSVECPTGTKRCHEAYLAGGYEARVIVNLQGDEPFLSAPEVQRAVADFKASGADIGTMIYRLGEQNADEIFDANTVKAVIDSQRRALYFSRAPIPHLRDTRRQDWIRKAAFYVHTGVYVYSPAMLAVVTSLPPSPLEQAESLEQLAWLEAGLSINCYVTSQRTLSVDTHSDLEKAVKIYNGNT